MSMITRNHDSRVCHEANKARLELMCQLKCLAGQLKDCDRRPFNPYPRREKPVVKYVPDKEPDCPTTLVCCPTVGYRNRSSSGIVRPRVDCQDHKSCQPDCVPCNASLRDLCDGFPQWFTDFIGKLENTRQPENIRICGQCVKEQSCRKS